MTAPTRPRWLMCRKRRPEAELRLYCFPHSGGSPGEYLRWADQLPEQVEVWGVQLPGRGSRVRETPLTDMRALTDALVAEAEFAPPFAFFGHSLGAPVAYETAVALRERGLPGPEHLFVSANGAPDQHRPGLPLHQVTGPDLLALVEGLYGPLPVELGEDPAFRELYLANLRADLTVVAGYQHSATAPLDCPITVFGGSEDWESESRLAEWRRHTTRDCEVHVLAGGHFYFRDRPDEFFARLTGGLTDCVRRLPAE